MKFKILTIFPEFFQKSLDFSLLKKAQEKGIVQFEIYNLRDWAKPKTVHMQVDDRPYGGGAGMVMMVEPVYRALQELKIKNFKLKNDRENVGPRIASVIFSPKGEKYDQVMAEKFANEFDEIILIAPHYEGFDERILDFVDYEISIGDYVLTGGEIPALVTIDSVARLLPGVVGNEESVKTESFSQLKENVRNLEYPQYTRPEIFIDDDKVKHTVPSVLLSGNHREIEEWRRGRTENEEQRAEKKCENEGM